MKGTTATFSVTADPAPSVDVTVAVQVYDAANRLDYVDDATLYFRLAANATSLSVPVATKKVTGDGLDGVVLALLQNGAGYTHSGTGYADVHDTDGATPSTITVSADPASVVEGGVITFTISRGTDSSGPLEVRYDLVDTGDVIDGEGTDLSATILDTTTSIGVPITTKTSDTDYGSDAGVELTLAFRAAV